MRWPQLPDYGYIPRWPEDGEHFIHPDDIRLARQCIPGAAIIRRDSFDGKFYQCSYGTVKFRIRPCLWIRVKGDGLDVGDLVETKGTRMQRDLFVGHIDRMRFMLHEGCIRYGLRKCSVLIPTMFRAGELRLLSKKTRIRPTNAKHPTPKWNGEGERIVVDLN